MLYIYNNMLEIINKKLSNFIGKPYSVKFKLINNQKNELKNDSAETKILTQKKSNLSLEDDIKQEPIIGNIIDIFKCELLK